MEIWSLILVGRDHLRCKAWQQNTGSQLAPKFPKTSLAQLAAGLLGTGGLEVGPKFGKSPGEGWQPHPAFLHRRFTGQRSSSEPVMGSENKDLMTDYCDELQAHYSAETMILHVMQCGQK